MANSKPIGICETCGKAYQRSPSLLGRFCSPRCVNQKVPAEDRFWKRVAPITDLRDCWLWTGGTNRAGGYGTLRVDDRPMQAHRYAWTLFHGPIPDGMSVLHRCDNPTCVNALFCLFLGTQADNMADMWRKGRARPGPQSPRRYVSRKGTRNQGSFKARFSDDEIRAIRASPEPHVVVARQVRTDPGTIRRIRLRMIYAYVT